MPKTMTSRLLKGEKYALFFPKSAFSKEEAEGLEAKFAAKGVTIIAVAYGNNSPCKPSIEKL